MLLFTCASLHCGPEGRRDEATAAGKGVEEAQAALVAAKEAKVALMAGKPK